MGASEPFSDIKTIGVINTSEACDTSVQVIAGVRSAGSVAREFWLPELGAWNKLNPLTAQYTESFVGLAGRNLLGLVKTNGLDGVVIISCCQETTLGLLMGCLRINCPVYVIPSHNHGLFKMLEGLGMTIENYTYTLASAFETGKQIVERAVKTHSPKRFFTKQALLSVQSDISGMVMAAKLVRANDTKLPSDWLVSKENGNLMVRGSACEEGGLVKVQENYPTQFNGQAWVYKTLEDADRAISGGQIKNGIVVLQNCAGINISIITQAIEQKNLESSVALATDGYCGNPTAVFTVTHCEGTAFSLIQTGDALEIDLGKGRFNTNVGSKDMRQREKRGSITKRELYF